MLCSTNLVPNTFWLVLEDNNWQLVELNIGATWSLQLAPIKTSAFEDDEG